MKISANQSKNDQKSKKNDAEKHDDPQMPFWTSLLYILERHGPEVEI